MLALRHLSIKINCYQTKVCAACSILGTRFFQFYPTRSNFLSHRVKSYYDYYLYVPALVFKYKTFHHNHHIIISFYTKSSTFVASVCRSSTQVTTIIVTLPMSCPINSNNTQYFCLDKSFFSTSNHFNIFFLFPILNKL